MPCPLRFLLVASGLIALTMSAGVERRCWAAGRLVLGGPDVLRPARLHEAARLEEWLAAVDAHQPGTFDAAAAGIASWPDDDLAAVTSDLDRLARFLLRARSRFQRAGESSTFRYRGRELSLADVRRLLRLTAEEARHADVSRLASRAVLLHTDIAVLVDTHGPETAGSRSAGSRLSALLVVDGRQIGLARKGPHWALARSLLDLVPSDPPHDETRRRWYVAAAAHMQSRALMSDLVPHLARARHLFPGDPDVLFHAGSMNETMAAPHVQEAITAAAPPLEIRLDARDARTHLLEARAAFQRAVAGRPDFAEARVRLGRVIGQLGRHDEAAAELRRAEGDAQDSVVRYLAALFLGGAHAHLDQRDDAREAFARAAALYPGAQAPMLGLSSMARAAGDRAGAIASLQNVLERRPDHPSRADPWWDYFVGSETEAERLLREWRTSITVEAGQ